MRVCAVRMRVRVRVWAVYREGVGGEGKDVGDAWCRAVAQRVTQGRHQARARDGADWSGCEVRHRVVQAGVTAAQVKSLIDNDWRETGAVVVQGGDNTFLLSGTKWVCIHPVKAKVRAEVPI